MTARQTAANLAPGEPVPWRSLERAAFEDFPEVVSRLRSSVGDGSSSRKFIHFRPLWLLGVGIYGTPLYGLVTVLGPRGLSQTSRTAQGDITVAGVIFGIALVLLLLYSGLWLWKGRPPKAAFGGYAAMAFFMGGISVFVAARRGIEKSVPAWELWSLPMLACTVIGGIFFFLVRRARRQAPIMAEPVQHERGGGTRTADAARQGIQVARIPPMLGAASRRLACLRSPKAGFRMPTEPDLGDLIAVHFVATGVTRPSNLRWR